MVIWMTGLSGSGKSTVANLLFEKIKPKIPELILIEGDDIRALFGASLDYSVASRVTQIQRLQKMARFLSRQKLFVIVTALYSNSELMAWNRKFIKNYFEIYMDTPLEVVMQRDVKGIYAQAKRGEMKNVVGFDIPWCAPKAPDLQLSFEKNDSPKKYADLIVEKCPFFKFRTP